MPLRGAQGLVQSILALMNLDLPTPHYSTLSRPQAGLTLEVPRFRSGQALHLVVDSTDCKVYGEGQWKVRQHGASKRPTWRKLHLGVDEKTGEIVAAVLSSNNVNDGQALPMLLEADAFGAGRRAHRPSERRWRLRPALVLSSFASFVSFAGTTTKAKATCESGNPATSGRAHLAARQHKRRKTGA